MALANASLACCPQVNSWPQVWWSSGASTAASRTFVPRTTSVSPSTTRTWLVDADPMGVASTAADASSAQCAIFRAGATVVVDRL
eukprot:scaffold408_cov347-Pavlova_lutheri.AAC.56